ncbi:MAG TPA: GNAT family N-acetyltransferase [bacterium]|nr:GNAT family N-acetyltransferase [bacterium]
MEIVEKRDRDGRELAKLLATAFSDKYKAMCDDIRTAEEIIAAEMEWRGADSNLFVALMDGEIAGSVEVVGLDFGCAPSDAVAENYLDRLGTGRGMKALYMLSLLGQSLERDEACVSQLAVAPRCQRRGVAAALLARAERYAEEKSMKYISLWVSAENAPAISLYHKLGYKIEKTRDSENLKRFFNCGRWLKMTKPLDTK